VIRGESDLNRIKSIVSFVAVLLLLLTGPCWGESWVVLGTSKSGAITSYDSESEKYFKDYFTVWIQTDKIAANTAGIVKIKRHTKFYRNGTAEDLSRILTFQNGTVRNIGPKKQRLSLTPGSANEAIFKLLLRYEEVDGGL
jgi:hypothetical protein